jgi:hypothetical protein
MSQTMLIPIFLRKIWAMVIDRALHSGALCFEGIYSGATSKATPGRRGKKAARPDTHDSNSLSESPH